MPFIGRPLIYHLKCILPIEQNFCFPFAKKRNDAISLAMAKKMMKSLELIFKRALKKVLLKILPKKSKALPQLNKIEKVLIFRLDQRIGNGILLLPTLRAIRATKPELEIHLLIHFPVADLLKVVAENIVDKTYPYNQPLLMRRPWRYLQLLRSLKKERYDIVFTTHNPDNFSLSQAIFGRLCKPRWLIGFDARESAPFYDIAVKSSTEKHYADAMIDLWRVINPAAELRLGALEIPVHLKAKMLNELPELAKGGILIWLGATGKKALPAGLITTIYEQSRKYTDSSIHFAAGPADEALLQNYPDWLREKTFIWRGSLIETAAFFSLFNAFISGDTGPMHLAVALGLPTLSIFVNSNIHQYGYHDGEKFLAILWDDTTKARLLLSEYIRQLFVR